MLKVKNLSGGYSNNPLIKSMSFHVEKGEMFGIIGPNGSGKTSLLKMLSNTLPIKQGEIEVNQKSILKYTAKEFAKIVAVLPQHMVQTYSYTVRETVSLGRYAHQSGLFKTATEKDEHIITEVMEQTGVLQYEHTLIDQLSGGERQRVFLAQALAQQPKILLLDEPTNHLDLAYQKELLDILRKWTREKDLTVIAIFHDLNLAGLYCDQLMLMEDGKIVSLESPEKVLKKHEIERVYQAQIEQYPHPEVPRPQLLLIPERDLTGQPQMITEENLRITKEYIQIKSETPLKTMSSGITGSGQGWHRNFINRQVDPYYDCSDYLTEMRQYLEGEGFSPDDTVGMMTAVDISNFEHLFLAEGPSSVYVVATAAGGNAVDASFGQEISNYRPGTINLWVFVNGYLTDQAFIQAIMTATEAKVKALQNLKVMDKKTNTLATGTPTDSMLIAGIQQGEPFEFAGTATKLGRLIGKAVHHCISRSLLKYFNSQKSKE